MNATTSTQVFIVGETATITNPPAAWLMGTAESVEAAPKFGERGIITAAFETRWGEVYAFIEIRGKRWMIFPDQARMNS